MCSCPMYQVDQALTPYSVASSWEPNITLIPQLMQSHDSASLIFLDASEVGYRDKVEDPWFSAHTSLLPGDDSSGGWLADEPTSVVACVAQPLFCNPNMPKSAGCINTLNKSVARLTRKLKGDGSRISQVWPNL